MASQFLQPLDALGPGGSELQRLLTGLQQKHQGLAPAEPASGAGEAAGGGGLAAKRPRLQQGPAADGGVVKPDGEAAGLLGGAAAMQAAPAPLLASLPAGLSLPFLPLGPAAGAGPPLFRSLGGNAFLPVTSTTQQQQQGLLPLPLPIQLAQQQQQQQQGAALPASLCLPAGMFASAAQLAAQPLMPAGIGAMACPQGAAGTAGTNGHAIHPASHPASHAETDSCDDGSGEGGGHGGGRRAKRTSEERLNANKEKNRRAQQRFRLRQKEKLHWLEAELARLRALCTSHGIDPSPGAPQPAALAATGAAFGPPVSTPAPLSMAVQQQRLQQRQQEQQQQAAAVAAQMAAAAAAAAAGAAPGAPTAQPSLEQIYEEVENMLDRCPTVPSTQAIAFLTVFQRTDAEVQRRQYRSLRRRFDAAKVEEVAACVAHWLAAAAEGGGAVLAGSPPPAGDGAAVAGVPLPNE